MSGLRPLLLLVSSVAYGLGISLPLMRFEKLFLFSETPSLIDICLDLWRENEVFLFLLVAAFSLVLPLLKLNAAFYAVLNRRYAQGWLTKLSRWSMMDVLLVALIIFAAKTSGLANAFSQPGVWFFATSTLTVAVAPAGLKGK